MRRHQLTIHRALALFVIGSLALMIACFSVADEPPPVEPTQSPAPLRELRVFIEPRDCASYILDPQPVEGSKYMHGAGVTISLVPSEDCSVKEWINVDSFSGLTGRVNLNADRIVQVNFERTGTLEPTQTATPTPTAVPSATPTPVPPTPTPVPSVAEAAVVIEPLATTLNIGETQQFSYTALDENGDEITGVLSAWSVDPQIGTIDSRGLFTPGMKAGLYPGAVVLKVVSGTTQATQSVTVDVVPDPLETVEVGPEQVDLPAEGFVQLTARGYDRYGNEIEGLEVLWESTPGLEVDEQGVLRKATGNTDGLAGWWRGEGNTLDSAGFNHGTVVNGLDYIPGVAGMAFKFNGVDQYIVIPPASELNITGDITVSFWAKRTEFDNPQVVLIIGGGAIAGIDVPSVYHLRFSAGEGMPVRPGNRILAAFERSDGTNINLVGPEVSDTAFHHYVYVRVGNTHKLYLDGTVVVDEAFTAVPGNISGLPSTIGAVDSATNPSGHSSYFGGIIDEVRVYNRALLDSEVRRLFEIESPVGHQVTVQATFKNSVRTATVDVNAVTE